MLACHPKYSLSRTVTRLAGGALVITFAGLCLPRSVLAQDVAVSVEAGSSSNPGTAGNDAEPPLPDQRADELIVEASELVTEQSWGEAASLYEQAAALRAPSDPRGVDELREAANLYAFARDGRKAVELLEAAGERALESGDAFSAAVSFQQAAALNGNIRGVRYKTTRLWERVCTLSSSPQVTDEQREALLRGVPECR